MLTNLSSKGVSLMLFATRPASLWPGLIAPLLSLKIAAQKLHAHDCQKLDPEQESQRSNRKGPFFALHEEAPSGLGNCVLQEPSG